MAVAFDAASSGNGANGGTLVGAVTLTHTPVGVPTGVVVWVAWYDGEFDTVLSSMTYGGVAMVKNTEVIGPVGTRIDHSGGGTGPTDNGNYWKIVLYGLASPPAGAQTVTAQFSGLDVYPIMGVVTVTGSDANNIFRDWGVTGSGTSTTPSLVIPSAAGDLTIDVCAGGPSWSGAGLDGFNITDLTTTGPNTRRCNQTVTNFGNTNTGAGSTAPGALNVTSSWSKAGSTGAHWYMAGASIRAANTGWSTIPIGGGGYIDGIDMAANGTTIVRSDTHPSPYFLSGGNWLPLSIAPSMPSAYAITRNATDKCAVGVWDCRICPSFTCKFYMITIDPAGLLFVTTNSGSTWTQLTIFPTQGDMGTNDNYRSNNYRMAVDPQNDAILFVGTYTGGLQRSLDSGVTWSTRTVGSGATTIGFDGNPAGMLIAFDPTSTVTTSATQGVFVGRMGSGVYHSTDGGGTFTFLNTSGMPTLPSQMMVDSAGTVWVVNNGPAGTGTLSKWTSGGGWVSVTIPFSIHSFDIDPLDATRQRMAMAAAGGAVATSTDGGTTWNSVYVTNTITGTDAPWMNLNFTTGSYFITDGKIKFDTQTSGKLWQAWGFGLMYAPNVFAHTNSVAFTTSVKGIEGLDATSIIHPPGGNAIGTGYDVPIWNFVSYTSPPTQYKPENYNNGLNPQNVTSSRGFALDFAKSTPTFIAAITGATANSSGGSPTFTTWYSTNSGVNWTPFTDQSAAPVNAFGSIACSTSSNIVIQSGDGLFYTTNGGTTFTASTYAGTNLSEPFAQGQRFIAADPVTTNKFVMISSGDGIYSSTNSGATFSKISSFVPVRIGYDQKILGIPGHSGHYLLTGGYLDTGTIPQAGNLFYRSTDGGVNWSSIANVGEVWAMDYGTVVSGASYPTIYVVGWVDPGTGSAFGVWRTDDNFTTFTLLGNTHNPMGWYSLIADVAGDKNIDGCCSIAYFGGGFKRFTADAGGGGGPVTPAFGFSVITDSGQRRTRMIGY